LVVAKEDDHVRLPAAKPAEQPVSVVISEPRMMTMNVTEDLTIAELEDGRVISVPITWSWRLSEATPEQRNSFEIIGNGEGAHWPDIDEDISVRGMLFGVPARALKKQGTSSQLGVTNR
jgi:hypothetical protein